METPFNGTWKSQGAAFPRLQTSVSPAQKAEPVTHILTTAAAT